MTDALIHALGVSYTSRHALGRFIARSHSACGARAASAIALLRLPIVLLVGDAPIIDQHIARLLERDMPPAHLLV